MDNIQSNSVIKPMESPKIKSNNKGGLILLIVFFAVILGVGTGFGITRVKGGASIGGPVGGKINSKNTVGVNDSKTFKDSAEGKLVKGGIDGEGTHHLERTGGESQNVYLTSSIVDLDQFIGKKVKIFGQTFASQRAGWLMDIGKVETK